VSTSRLSLGEDIAQDGDHRLCLAHAERGRSDARRFDAIDAEGPDRAAQGVPDQPAALDRLLARGAELLEPITERGPGFVTASVSAGVGDELSAPPWPPGRGEVCVRVYTVSRSVRSLVVSRERPSQPTSGASSSKGNNQRDCLQIIVLLLAAARPLHER
jgi:hypothetical protein